MSSSAVYIISFTNPTNRLVHVLPVNQPLFYHSGTGLIHHPEY